MTYDQLYVQIMKKGSFLCVGLDTDIEKIPACVKEQAKAASLPEEDAVWDSDTDLKSWLKSFNKA